MVKDRESVDPALQQLAALKTATIHFDCVHDAQILQLKSYPILISGVKQPWKVQVDIERKNVVYNLQGRKTKTTERDQKIVEGYIRKYILWDDTKVDFNWS